MKFLFAITIFIYLSLSLFSQTAILELNNGNKYTVKIYGEDSTKYYFNMVQNGGKVKSYMQKDSVKSLEYKHLGTSPFDISFGGGSAHGCLGTKVVLGKDNSGLFAGIGMAPHGHISPSIGLQIALGHFFGNYGYGSRGVYKINDSPYRLDMDVFYNLGFLVRFGDSDQYFLEIAFGGTGNNNKFDGVYGSFEYFRYNGTLAFGINL